jgi:hypothetical protein
VPFGSSSCGDASAQSRKRGGGIRAPVPDFRKRGMGSPPRISCRKAHGLLQRCPSLVLILSVDRERHAAREGNLRGEASHQFRPRDDEPPSPELEKQQRLERENADLRLRVKHLQSALRCAVKTLSPYATDRKR